jgi:peptide/nickel transport system permease protein
MTDKRKKANLRTQETANSYEVASQWKLMAWKFKKHKAAMISVPILIIYVRHLHVL